MTTTTTHKPECLAHMEAVKKLVAEELERHPHYCRGCFGYGYTVQENWLADEYDIVSCVNCFGKNLCPVCKTPLKTESEQDYAECSACQWRSNGTGNVFVGLHEPLCICTTETDLLLSPEEEMIGKHNRVCKR